MSGHTKSGGLHDRPRPYDDPMELAFERGGGRAPEPQDDRRRPATPPLTDECAGQGGFGTSTGVNISPGSDDDGWIVPDPVKLADGTHIQLYKDGEALHAAYEAIKNAKRRIGLEVYIFACDETGMAFADLLADKARQGVRTFVIYDALGSLGGGADVFDRMRRAGVHVQPFHPIYPWELKFGWRPWNRDHRKLLVIDDDIAGLGGLNVGGNYAGSWVVQATGASTAGCDLWRDNAIGIRGPGSRMYRESFAKTWHYVVRGGRVGRAEHVHNLEAGELGVLASVPSIKSPLRPALIKYIRGAQRSLLMTMAYFAPDDELVSELCKAAKRGARVRLMLPGRSDVKLLQIAARSFYERMMSCGIEVYERQAVVLHSKTMVVDGERTIIGSTNLDSRSIVYNCEISSIIRSKEFGRQMHELFENDVRYAKKFELQEWRRRPHVDRFVQWAVSRARYLL